MQKHSRGTVSQQIGVPVRPLNIGRGYTTLAEHDLVLRSLYEQCASSMEGATVFIEAAAGLPDFSTFNDSWVHPDEPWLIVPVIDWQNLVRMWMASDTPRGNKVDVSMRYSLQAVSYIDWKRRRLLQVGDQVVSRLGARITTGGENGAADLSSAGGILSDRASVERARRLAVELAQTTFKDSPRADWQPRCLWMSTPLPAGMAAASSCFACLSPACSRRHIQRQRALRISRRFVARPSSRISTICRSSSPRRTRISPTIGI